MANHSGFIKVDQDQEQKFKQTVIPRLLESGWERAPESEMGERAMGRDTILFRNNKIPGTILALERPNDWQFLVTITPDGHNALMDDVMPNIFLPVIESLSNPIPKSMLIPVSIPTPLRP